MDIFLGAFADLLNLPAEHDRDIVSVVVHLPFFGGKLKRHHVRGRVFGANHRHHFDLHQIHLMISVLHR